MQSSKVKIINRAIIEKKNHFFTVRVKDKEVWRLENSSAKLISSKS